MIGECWEVTRWSHAPEKIKIISETEKTYTEEKIDWNKKPYTSRSMKAGKHVFATWDEAKAFMVSYAEEALEAAKRNVDRARSVLEVAKALKP